MNAAQNSQAVAGGVFAQPYPLPYRVNEKLATGARRRHPSLGFFCLAHSLGLHPQSCLLCTFPDACLSHLPEGFWAFLISLKSRSSPPPLRTLSLVWKLLLNSLRVHKILSLPPTLLGRARASLYVIPFLLIKKRLHFS